MLRREIVYCRAGIEIRYGFTESRSKIDLGNRRQTYRFEIEDVPGHKQGFDVDPDRVEKLIANLRNGLSATKRHRVREMK